MLAAPDGSFQSPVVRFRGACFRQAGLHRSRPVFHEYSFAIGKLFLIRCLRKIYQVKFVRFLRAGIAVIDIGPRWI